jgi:hypothetical protein
MKIAEALLLRADMQKRLESLRDRISKNVVVQEGEQPAENPEKLLADAMRIAEEFQKMIFSINKANLSGKTARSRSLTEAIAERDALVLKHSILNTAVNSAVKPPDRFGLREIRWVKAVEIKPLQDQVETLAKQIREVNIEIQAANWQIEIN